MSQDRTRRWRLAAGLILSVLAGSCGGSSSSSSTPHNPSPTAPTGVPADVVDMNGTWVGTLESPDRGVQQVSLTVVQFANCVDGTWKSSSSDARGALSGFAGKDSYTGLLSFELGSCLGVVEVTGNVGADSLRLTGGQVAKSSGSGACAAPLPESVVLALRRQ
jgi:hypothetical protein